MYNSGRVHRTYKEHNRWMYVAPQRNTFCLKSFLDGLLIFLAFGAIIFAVAVMLVILLIG